jgi:C1A family cysteine protease
MRASCIPRSKAEPLRVLASAAALAAAALAVTGLTAPALADLPGMGFVPVPHTSMRAPFETQPMASGHQARDLRDEHVITPAKHQGCCGACWAFAAITCVETACLLSDPTLDPQSFDLSEQHLVSCDTEVWELEGFGTTRNYGCQGGSAVAFEFIRHYGIATEAVFPYSSGASCGNGTCPPSLPSLSGWQVLDWDFVRSDAGVPSVAEMKSAIDEYGAIWAGFIVYEDFIDGTGGGFWYEAGPGSIYQHLSGARVGAHAVAVIGYDDAQSCWIAKNSWGESAGPDRDGTFRIAYDAACSFGLNAAWVSVGYFGAPSPVVETTWGALKSLFADRD